MNIHYLILGLALLFAVVDIVKQPYYWACPVAILLVCIELFYRVSK